MNGYSAFPKSLALLEPHIQDTLWGESYPSAEKQSVYSTAPADWVINGDVKHPREAAEYTGQADMINYWDLQNIFKLRLSK